MAQIRSFSFKNFMLLLGSALLAWPTAPEVQAQTASNLAPSTFQPQSRRATGPVTVARDPGAPVPEGAERFFVTVGDVRLEGALPQLEEANTAFRERLTGQRVAVSEIFAATAQLENAYANAGYVLVRVVLPQQTVRDGGTLRIVVIDGFVERVDTSKVPEPVRERVATITQGLVGRRGVRLQEIERALLLAGDTFGVQLSSTLTAGDEKGGTALLLEGEYKRITGSYGFDNTLSDDLGSVNLSFGVELNGALGLGETFYARAGGSPTRFFSDSSQYRILAGGAVVPIGYDGMTFNAEVTSSRASPDPGLVTTSSSFDRLSLRLYYPWVRTRKFNLSSQLILDRSSDEQNLDIGTTTLPIYDDELSVLRATVDGSWGFEDGSFLQASAILSRGLDAFGARRTPTGAATPLSRQGADAVFTKLVIGGAYERPLDPNWSLTLRGRLQENFGDPLVTSEQFSIASGGELSAFDAGSLRGDDGWVVRSEIGRTSQASIAGFPIVIKPFLFGAYGVLGLEQPTILEQDKTKAYSYGLGVDLITIEDSAYKSGSIRLEYGRGERDDRGDDGNRFSIVASRRF